MITNMFNKFTDTNNYNNNTYTYYILHNNSPKGRGAPSDISLSLSPYVMYFFYISYFLFSFISCSHLLSPKSKGLDDEPGDAYCNPM